MYAYAAGHHFIVAVLAGSAAFLPRPDHPSQALHANRVQHADIICDAHENNKASFGSEMFQQM
jgi:hypothetical protein